MPMAPSYTLSKCTTMTLRRTCLYASSSLSSAPAPSWLRILSSSRWTIACSTATSTTGCRVLWPNQTQRCMSTFLVTISTLPTRSWSTLEGTLTFLIFHFQWLSRTALLRTSSITTLSAIGPYLSKLHICNILEASFKLMVWLHGPRWSLKITLWPITRLCKDRLHSTSSAKAPWKSSTTPSTPLATS